MGRGISFTGAAILTALTLATTIAAGAAHGAGDGGHGAEADAGGLKVTPSAHYVPIDTLTTTVTRDYRVNGVMQIDAGLEIKDAALRARAVSMRPRLRDAYTAALIDYAGGAYRPGRVPDTERLHAMLQAATDRTLGAPGADFLLGMVIVH